MGERPILFSAPMVRAILEGRKTQTRRVVKMQPRSRADIGHHGAGLPFIRNLDPFGKNAVCPYGQPGDRLWVRETWTDLTETHGRQYERRNAETGLYERGTEPFVWYRADGEQPDNGNGAEKYAPWRPSIHMPRWASRIDLEVTGVRVERLHSISEADAIAEGSPDYEEGAVPPPPDHDWDWSYRSSFRRLWESINGPGSWDANPWVWVVEFQRSQPSQRGEG